MPNDVWGRPRAEAVSGAAPLDTSSREQVMLTADVEPYELMKLRLLNSSHSALSCAAVLGEERVACAWLVRLLSGALVRRDVVRPRLRRRRDRRPGRAPLLHTPPL